MLMGSTSQTMCRAADAPSATLKVGLLASTFSSWPSVCQAACTRQNAVNLQACGSVLLWARLAVPTGSVGIIRAEARLST